MKRNLGGRWVTAALLAATAGTAGFAGAAVAQQGGPMHALHGHAMGSMSPADMDAQFDSHIAALLPDATPEQKARLKTIAATFHAELGAVHGQFREAHSRAPALLLGQNVDRAGLESLRVQQMRALDGASRQLFAALADAADVLTPEQRQRVAAHLAARAH